MSAWPPFHADDEASDETMRVYPSTGDGDYYPPASSGYAPQPSGPPYPTASSGAPYGVPVPYDPPQHQVMPAPPPARNSSIARLFMVTVMVVVVVAGAVSVVYILANGRDSAPQPGPAAAAPPSAAPSASSASSRVDGCVVGEWLATSWKLTDTDAGTSITTDNAGFLRLRADATGEFDFGSGVTLKGKIEGVTSEVMIIGKVGFTYETANQTLTSRVVAADARRVVFQSGRTVVNERYGDDGEATTDTYVCAGDSLRFKSEGQELEYRRR
jgi:hypothetical protein